MKINRIIMFLCFCFLFGGDIDQQLKIAGKNKNQIKKAYGKFLSFIVQVWSG